MIKQTLEQTLSYILVCCTSDCSKVVPNDGIFDQSQPFVLPAFRGPHLHNVVTSFSLCSGDDSAFTGLFCNGSITVTLMCHEPGPEHGGSEHSGPVGGDVGA